MSLCSYMLCVSRATHWDWTVCWTMDLKGTVSPSFSRSKPPVTLSKHEINGISHIWNPACSHFSHFSMPTCVVIMLVLLRHSHCWELLGAVFLLYVEDVSEQTYFQLWESFPPFFQQYSSVRTTYFSVGFNGFVIMSSTAINTVLRYLEMWNLHTGAVKLDHILIPFSIFWILILFTL